MARYLVVLLAFGAAGCGDEKGLADLDGVRLMLAVDPSIAGELNVGVRIDWRSDGGCTSLAEDVRVTLDDSAIDSSSYLGGDNDKAHGCNDCARTSPSHRSTTRRAGGRTRPPRERRGPDGACGPRSSLLESYAVWADNRDGTTTTKLQGASFIE